MGKKKPVPKKRVRVESERRVRATLTSETHAYWAAQVGPGKSYKDWAHLLETLLRDEQARRTRRS